MTTVTSGKNSTGKPSRRLERQTGKSATGVGPRVNGETSATLRRKIRQETKSVVFVVFIRPSSVETYLQEKGLSDTVGPALAN